MAFIVRYQRENDGASPSLQEISTAVGLATRAAAHALLARLAEAGRIDRASNARRSIKVVRSRSKLIIYSDEELLAECNRRGLVGTAGAVAAQRWAHDG